MVGMAHWLLKTEPSTYSFADLQRDGKTRWDGVTNPLALKHMRATHKGDEAFLYHTGGEKAVIGVVRLLSDPYPDPRNARLVVFDLGPLRALARPVTLAEVKADPAFAGWELVRAPRLSVMPVPEAFWQRVLRLSAKD